MPNNTVPTKTVPDTDTIPVADLVETPGGLMTAFSTLAAAGDLDRLLDLYLPDATFQPEEGVNLSGHDQIRPAMAEFLTLRPQIRYLTEPDVVITGDIALVTNHWTMTGTAPDGSPVAEGGVSADVLASVDDGSWRILIDQPRGVPVA